ncbi:MAG: DNA integrity scanning diadenylate cyclase DisA [Clostridia bacterium]|nr:DNA integrity scanning diadenylate cyclase DisA [Clostridia bacterium]
MFKEEILDILKMLAPGTVLRNGLDNILKAKTGALIVIGESDEVMKLVDGGFSINEDFTPANIYELAKMDGAIVISKDLKKILKANTQLVPDSKIRTIETGTRHRTAERVAKQTNELVICISQRRGIITIFKGDFRYVINDTSAVILRANQTLEALEKYKAVFDSMMNILTEHEFDDIVSLETVANAIYRSEIIMRMETEVERNIIELGDEGRLVNMQLEELIANVESEEEKIIKDYMVIKKKNSKTAASILSEIRKLDKKDLIMAEKIIKLLGYEAQSDNDLLDINASPRGYRILSKVPKMPLSIIEKIVSSFSNIQGVCSATIEELDEVEGIGEIRSKIINQSLRRLQEQYLLKGYNI